MHTMSDESWLQGAKGLLKIQRPSKETKASNLQRNLDVLEDSIVSFFKNLATQMEQMEGVDLTDKGDDIVGMGLCMLATESQCEDTSDESYVSDSCCSSSQEEKDNEEDTEEEEEEEEEKEPETKKQKCSDDEDDQ